MTTEQIAKLVAEGREHEFYTGADWKRVAAMVRKYDRNECQMCKQAGRYARGAIVHHVLHLKDRPDLALAMYNPDTGARQLITICKQCHEKEHPEALWAINEQKYQPITEEKWE